MELASGIAGDKPFAVIDTESRRALHYADAFRFDHAEFAPAVSARRRTADAIRGCGQSRGYSVIIVDSTGS